jgi:hypothetical protein
MMMDGGGGGVELGALANNNLNRIEDVDNGRCLDSCCVLVG